MDYSIESLIAEGTGLKVKDTIYPSTSTEAYDGYSDAVCAELSRSFENLEFLDTYSKINAANSDAKLRMMKRLKRVYGSTIDDQAKASSVESYIDNNIKSVEADENKGGKVKAFFGRIIDGLKKMFEAIKKFFQWIWDKIRGLFTKKTEKNSRVANAEEIKQIFSEGGLQDRMGKDKNGNTTFKQFGRNEINQNTHKMDGSRSDFLVEFDKIRVNKAQQYIKGMLTTKDIANALSAMKGGKTPNGTNLYRDNANSNRDVAAGVATRSMTQIGKGTTKEILNVDDFQIAAKCFDAKKATPEYVAKLGVGHIRNLINKMCDLQKDTKNVEKLVDTGIKQCENYAKASNGAIDEKVMNEFASILRDTAKAAQRITSVGLKISNSAYKCLVPLSQKEKTDNATRNENEGRLAKKIAGEMKKGQKKTA